MRTRVKICGLTELAHVEAAVEAGADALGFVLEPTSPRHVSVGVCRRLLAAVPDHVEKVAVLAAPTPALFAAIDGLPFDSVQMDAPHALPTNLAGRVRLLPSLRDGADLATRVIEARSLAGAGSVVLVDGPRGGGRGELADHPRIAVVAWRFPIVLAGGLDPDNVTAALGIVRPFGVDVSSGVERSRGVKDPRRIQAFLQAVQRHDETHRDGVRAG